MNKVWEFVNGFYFCYTNFVFWKEYVTNSLKPTVSISYNPFALIIEDYPEDY